MTKKPKRQVELEQKLALLEQDKARLDWLERQYVTVRTPLVYGSRHAFSANCVLADPSEEPEPSDLRNKIDQQLKKNFTGE